MITEQITPTRSALNQKRAQIELVKKGRDLLQQKRNALMQELRRSADEVLFVEQALDEAAGAARRALALSLAHDGPEVVGSASLAAQEPISVNIGSTRVMGVHVLRIEPKTLVRTASDRPHSPTHSAPRMDATALAFEAELEALLDVANQELRLRRLAQAIRETIRRVNALEYILLPRLQKQHKLIELRLTEREREDIYRMKMVKARYGRAATRQAH
ncbi:MAG TPA: V-type ATP synthase subunit D [Anaerolineae bacterium]|nr:V-type ATP synthase subunit D [Caldilineae bacterium]HID33333.1 V-type ATP synthase subunit D [Anaerolineae bacterium]HIQ11757.1 V-type ATP synthase subunit D [Caldilineales bacterium]